MSLFAPAFSWSEPSPLGRLGAGADDPVYTIYAAPYERSTFIPDEGYRLIFQKDRPLQWLTDTAGTVSLSWTDKGTPVETLTQYSRRPLLRRSYSDCAELAYSPLANLEVVHRFAVYSSTFLIHEMQVANRADELREPHLILRLDLGQPMRELDVPRALDQVFFRHREPPESWSEKRLPGVDYTFENLLLTRPAFSGARLLDRQGTPLTEDALTAFRKRRRKQRYAPWGIALDLSLSLPANGEITIRWLRGVSSDSPIRLWAEAESLLTEVRFPDLFEAAEHRLDRVPRIPFADRTRELVYWQSFSFMQQLLMPAEGELSHDYLVAAREPTWGAGREGQTLPESLALLALGFLNPERAQESQRAYMQHQLPDGYLHHRVGPYVLQDYPHKGRRTSAPPFFNWINWELFRISQDRKFLGEAYEAGSRFARFWLRNRDQDADGLYEWGGHAALESGREDGNVIWQLLGKRPPDAGLVEAVDLNALLSREFGSLALQAEELGLAEEAAEWEKLQLNLNRRIREQMWDPETGFFYHLGRIGNRFLTEKGIDLRRMELVGFLPMWAGAASQQQSQRLAEHLTNRSRFRRARGVPSLAASDPEYHPGASPCCRWDGPLHVGWNYLIFRGLLENGYRAEAEELAARLYAAAARQLETTHTLTGSHHPDEIETEPILPAVSAGLLARMSLDLAGAPVPRASSGER